MSRTEEYYRYLATGKGTIPKPLTREEQYLYAICTELDPEALAFAKEYSEIMDGYLEDAQGVLEDIQEVQESIPQDYSTMSADVDELKTDLIALEQQGYPYASISEAVDAWADDHAAEIVNNYVTPQMFGAKGDGVADDTTALQTALSHPEVYIPYGDYRITDILTYSSKKIVADAGATITYDGAYSAAVLNPTADSIEIYGLIIDGNGKSAKGIAVSSAQTAAEKVIIKNCVCKNFDNLTNAISTAGIYVLRRTKHVEIDGCTINNVQRTTGNSGTVASVGIAAVSIDGTCKITNNYITGVYYDQTVHTDADGIQAYLTDATVQGIKTASVQINNNVITQCQGRFIKIQGDDCVVENNTMVNNAIAVIDSFRGIDLQTGKGYCNGNRMLLNGITSSNLNGSAFISCTARNYTNDYCQFTVTNNVLQNDSASGNAVLFVPYDKKTTIIITGNQFHKFAIGFSYANASAVSSAISIIVCNNWFDSITSGIYIRTDSPNISKIIENNAGYVYDNSVIPSKFGKSFEITASTINDFCAATYNNFTEVGNYICQSKWKTHSTFCCIVSVFTSTSGMAAFFSGGYVYVYAKTGAETATLYTFQYKSTS